MTSGQPTLDDTRTMTRAFTFPQAGDTVATLAARVLPERDDAAEVLLSWNPHLVLRAAAWGQEVVLLCSDVVYTEPPS